MECVMILECEDWARVSVDGPDGEEIRESGPLDEVPAMVDSVLSSLR